MTWRIAVGRGDVREPCHQLRAWTTRRAPRPRVAPRKQRELALDVVERALGAVEQDETCRIEVEHLARELGADRPAGAVTSTVWPASSSRRPASSMTTGSRRRRSSTWTSRIAAAPSRPDTSSSSAGTVRVSRPSRVASSTARRTTSPDAVRDRDEEPPGAGHPGDLRELVDRARGPSGRAGPGCACPVVVEDADDPHPEAVPGASRSCAGPSPRHRRRRRRASGRARNLRRLLGVASVGSPGRQPCHSCRGADEEPDAAHAGEREQALEHEERPREAPDGCLRPADAERDEDEVEEHASRRSIRRRPRRRSGPARRRSHRPTHASTGRRGR